MKTAQFSLKPPSTVAATAVLRILKNATNVQRNKKESHIDIEYRLFSLITILFSINLLFYIAICGASFRTNIPKTPIGIPLDFYTLITNLIH